MKLTNGGYFIKEAFASMTRNRFLSLATISTISVSIFILGAAFLLAINASNYMSQLESDVEMVAFVEQRMTEAQTRNIGLEIQRIEGVSEVTFISRDESLRGLQSRFIREGYDLADTLGFNPLPDTYEVKAADPRQVGEVAARIGNIHGIYKVNYGQGIVERIFSLTNWVRILSIVMIIFLLLGSIFLISVNIRLAIFARRKEIYLMKLIGAKDSFIRWPFFIEGVILGLLGSTIAVLLLASAYAALLGHWPTVITFIPLVDTQEFLIQSYLGLIGAGMVLGILGTMFSINRFMDV